MRGKGQRTERYVSLAAISLPEMQARARAVRRFAVQATARTRASHIGSALSVTDILVAIYFAAMRPDQTGVHGDHCILSKGHAAVALYGVLAERGILRASEIEHFYENGSLLAGHPEPNARAGIIFGSGSLGHGLPVSNGISFGKRLAGVDGHTWVVMSDGECEEGSTWEAALFAAQHRLGNLTAVVDRNGIQGMGSTESILGLEPFAEKWRAFGWRTIEVDGHDLAALAEAVQPAATTTEQPTMVIARTTKGKGVSFMEANNDWHYRSANPDELATALTELAG
ncbi:MAG: transketolase [Chloroflexi bacterium]|nr:MAG: transketolase [Chloroflexota bacterium]